jgi:hypothetical protein
MKEKHGRVPLAVVKIARQEKLTMYLQAICAIENYLLRFDE